MAQGPKHNGGGGGQTQSLRAGIGQEGFLPINERAERKRGWAEARDLYARGTSRNPVEGDLSGFANNETMFQTAPPSQRPFFSFLSLPCFGTTLRFHEGFVVGGFQPEFSSPLLRSRKEN